jgi:hypothetical protein
VSFECLKEEKKKRREGEGKEGVGWRGKRKGERRGNERR